ncbi:uncharacterized protein EV154DRAFT_487169 [Mucor mucedo]|uniref:uncharacterized protein n=1 Tax=Mucor mucedo TaxID=29922 RepID=UPI00221F3C3D|nr:uncharacterized protein EV154DRAFT_487169 [Mucor mucedo]KAI7873530.1 hypothetical protein EV154DRAFT_487169 [Mucor mucedo]
MYNIELPKSIFLIKEIRHSEEVEQKKIVVVQQNKKMNGGEARKSTGNFVEICSSMLILCAVKSLACYFLRLPKLFLYGNINIHRLQNFYSSLLNIESVFNRLQSLENANILVDKGDLVGYDQIVAFSCESVKRFCLSSRLHSLNFLLKHEYSNHKEDRLRLHLVRVIEERH